MALVWVLLGILVLGGVAVVAAGRGEGLPHAEPDRPDLALPAEGPLVRSDVDQVRFSVGLRGYRMDEVDDVLDRLALDLEARDERIAVLEREVVSRAPEPAELAGPVAPAALDEPIEEPAAEPVAEPAHEPVADEAAEEVADQVAGPSAAPEDRAAEADDDLMVGRTMIVPFQQTDSRFAAPDTDEDPRGSGA